MIVRELDVSAIAALAGDEPCAPLLLNRMQPSADVVATEDSRLVPQLRFHAKLKQPLECLAEAAAERYRSVPNPSALAIAFSDLAVTGTDSAEAFRASPPSVNAIDARAVQILPGDATTRLHHAQAALDRAQAVFDWLTGTSGDRPPGYIAVSGEDDAAWRPMNVPRFASFESDIVVAADGISVRARYGMRLHPNPTDIIVLLHGHSSRLEEYGDLMDALFDGGRSVIAFDLPNSGYSGRFDHRLLGPLNSDCNALLFLERYTIAFLEAVRARHSQVGAANICVAGGSLGGNLSLRIARRKPAWLTRVAPWSAACVWSTFVGDVLKELGLTTCRNGLAGAEDDAARAKYFGDVFDTTTPLTDGLACLKQPQQWYRRTPDWIGCAKVHIEDSEIDRREIYGEAFRRWHWRVAYEQLVYSFLTSDRYKTLEGPLLFLAGKEDDFNWTGICSATKSLGEKLTIPGRTLLLENTGHSIHNERPKLLAKLLGQFLDGELD